MALGDITEIRGLYGEIRAAHVFKAIGLQLQTMVSLTAEDTVDLQGDFRAADGYFVTE